MLISLFYFGSVSADAKPCRTTRRISNDFARKIVCDVIIWHVEVLVMLLWSEIVDNYLDESLFECRFSQDMLSLLTKCKHIECLWKNQISKVAVCHDYPHGGRLLEMELQEERITISDSIGAKETINGKAITLSSLWTFLALKLHENQFKSFDSLVWII